MPDPVPNGTTTPAPAAGTAPADTVRDEVRFSQRQVDAIVADERRTWKGKFEEATARIATLEKAIPAPAPEGDKSKGNGEGKIDERFADVNRRFAELDFREWAAGRGFNQEQRSVFQRFIDLDKPDTWEEVSKGMAGVLGKLATAGTPGVTTNPAPAHPATADAPGTTAGGPASRDPFKMSREDLSATTREERDKIAADQMARVTGRRGRFFQVPPSATKRTG